MKILWSILLIGLVAAEVSDETSEQLIKAASDTLLPTEMVEFWKAFKKVDAKKMEKFDEEVDCNTGTDTILKSAAKLSPEFGEKTKNLIDYIKKKYDALNPEAKKFFDELKSKTCTLLTEDDSDDDSSPEYEEFLSATAKKYLTLSQATQDNIEAQFPIISLAKSAVVPPSQEKIEAAVYALFPAVVGDFLKALENVDRTKLAPLLDCSIGSMDEFFKRAKDVSPDFADKSKKLYDSLKKKYDALGPNGKKFFEELKPNACGLLKIKERQELKKAVKAYFTSAIMKYLGLPKATKTEINKQFPAVALANAAYQYYIESQMGSKFSPKFRRFI